MSGVVIPLTTGTTTSTWHQGNNTPTVKTATTAGTDITGLRAETVCQEWEDFGGVMAPGKQQKLNPNQYTVTREQYGLDPDHYQPTWIDVELRKRAEARRADALADKTEADKPRWRLVRRGRQRQEDGRPGRESAE
jgi:hypothetical protein